MTTEGIRLLNLGLAVAGLVGWLLVARVPQYRAYAVVVLTWLVNVTAFWITAIALNGSDPELINSWSRIVYLQATILLAGTAFLMLWQKK